MFRGVRQSATKRDKRSPEALKPCVTCCFVCRRVCDKSPWHVPTYDDASNPSPEPVQLRLSDPLRARPPRAWSPHAEPSSPPCTVRARTGHPVHHEHPNPGHPQPNRAHGQPSLRSESVSPGRADRRQRFPSSRDLRCFYLGFCRCAGVRVGRVNPDSATVTVTHPPRTSPTPVVRTRTPTRRVPAPHRRAPATCGFDVGVSARQFCRRGALLSLTTDTRG